MDFQVTHTFNQPALVLYQAWLSTKEHGNMTGSPADVSDVVGGTFSAWDGYISGENIELIPNEKIIQKWRTTEFAEEEEDSILEIIFEERDGETTVRINHSNLPEHGMQYKQGWVDSYFSPMMEYFS